MNRLLIVTFALFLTACGGGNGGDDTATATGTVRIDCADLSNTSTSGCGTTTTSFSRAAAATSVVDYGEITRDDIVWIHATVKNETDTMYVGYFTVVLDVDCKNGTGRPWTPFPLQSVIVDAMNERLINVGARCGGADFGQSTITFSLYDDASGNEEFLRDRIVGTFTMVE